MSPYIIVSYFNEMENIMKTLTNASGNKTVLIRLTDNGEAYICTYIQRVNTGISIENQVLAHKFYSIQDSAIKWAKAQLTI